MKRCAAILLLLLSPCLAHAVTTFYLYGVPNADLECHEFDCDTIVDQGHMNLSIDGHPFTQDFDAEVRWTSLFAAQSLASAIASYFGVSVTATTVEDPGYADFIRIDIDGDFTVSDFSTTETNPLMTRTSYWRVGPTIDSVAPYHPFP